MIQFSTTEPLLECVPNISEGRDLKKIAAFAKAIQSVPDVKLLHQDIGYDANRTVFTFAGPPEAVAEAAFQLAKKVAELLDMRTQTGAHPRIGALDVCPLVPLKNMTLQDADHYAQQLAARLGAELSIPVYCYEASAKFSERKNLATIRRGQYEGLAEKMKTPDWKPDYGPTDFQPVMGATVLGARSILVAYNVHLEGATLDQAQRIAARVRASGRLVRHIETGVRTRIPGRLSAVKAIGWYMPEYQRAQVSMNLVDVTQTTAHQAYEVVKEEAIHEGVAAVGSELIGMAPLAVFEAAARFYNNLPTSAPVTRAQLDIAVQAMGFDAHTEFQLEERVLEWGL